jgi:hypothetical protein
MKVVFFIVYLVKIYCIYLSLPKITISKNIKNAKDEENGNGCRFGNSAKCMWFI